MNNKDLGSFILRLTLGALMLLHGFAKFKGVDWMDEPLIARGLPTILKYGVFVGEIIIPIMLILGIRTRFAALIFMINCGFAVWLAHSSDIFKLSSHGGWSIELLGLYFFGALALFFFGGGKYSFSQKSSWD